MNNKVSSGVFTPCEICNPKVKPLCTVECQSVCPEIKKEVKDYPSYLDYPLK